MRHPKRRPSGLVDILDRVLDKGIVIDATVRVSLVGIDLLGVDAKITVASFETYLQLSQDPRAYELGLVSGSAPESGEREERVLPVGQTRSLPEPAVPIGGGGGGEASDPERLGRAAHHEEARDMPAPDEPDPASGG